MGHHNASKSLRAVVLAAQQVQQQGTRQQTDSAHQKFQDLPNRQTDYKKVLEDELDLGCAQMVVVLVRVLLQWARTQGRFQRMCQLLRLVPT